MKFFKHLIIPFMGLAISSVIPVNAASSLNVVTCYPQDAAMVRAVGGEYVKVDSLAKASYDPHSVQPKSSFSVLLNRADLLVTNGQDMDMSWIPVALSNARNPKILDGADGNFDPSEGVKIIPYANEELQQTPFFSLSLVAGATQAGGGQVSVKRGNHHYWLDPSNDIIVARNIANKLTELDPAHSTQYKENADIIESTLKARIIKWDAEMAPYKGTPVVSYHRDWIYLIERYGFKLVGYVEPRETSRPDSNHIKLLVAQMTEAKAKLLLTSPWQNRLAQDEIVKKTGVINVSLPSTVGPVANLNDYISMFDTIHSKLLEALKASK